MNAHLAQIARTVAPGAHALLTLDGAGWHGSAALTVPDTLALLTLPPCSPDLTPVENVWPYLRATRLAITVFDTYDDIRDARCTAWNFFANNRRHHPTIMGRGQSVGPLVLLGDGFVFLIAFKGLSRSGQTALARLKSG
ncbi:MAG: transposase [Candidatus Saccharibacteria bacterium]|nr:transposase [Pseudorhodobacter sp.]